MKHIILFAAIILAGCSKTSKDRIVYLSTAQRVVTDNDSAYWIKNVDTFYMRKGKTFSRHIEAVKVPYPNSPKEINAVVSVDAENDKKDQVVYQETKPIHDIDIKIP